MIKTLAVQLVIISLSVTTHAAEEGYEEDLRQLDARLAPDYLVPGTKFEEEDGHDQYLEEKRLFEEWLDSNPLVITKDGFVMPVKEAEAAGIYDENYEFLDAPPEAQYYEQGVSE